jgi:SAM-dependent methyltransferase
MPPKSIRYYYEKYGAEQFYVKYSDKYYNPHILQIDELLKKNMSRIDYSHILDFCSGTGEVTRIIKSLGYDIIEASDPYTNEIYEKKNEIKCYKLSFDDILKDRLYDYVDEDKYYSAIICSFALHLCPSEQLFNIVYTLFMHTSQLIIITPHKRPCLEQFDIFKLDFTDYALTLENKKIYLKSYSKKVDYK